MTNYRIVAELDEMVYFETADTREEAEQIMTAYLDKEEPRAVKMFKLDNCGGYTLVRKMMRMEKPTYRPIGFGRW